MNKDINRPPSAWSMIVAQFKKDPFAIACLVVFLAIVLTSFILGSLVDEEALTRLNRDPRTWDNPPLTGHGLLGTDARGRDMLGILLLSARNSLAISLIVTPASFAIGYTVGLIAGFFGKFVDLAILRFIDFWSMVPNIMIIIAMVAVLPVWGVREFIILMIILGWFSGARIMRARVLQESAKDYILASKTLGTPNYKIIFKKVLPNVTSIMMVSFVIGLANSIGMETGLTVIGYGLPSTTPSLGRLISYATRPTIMQDRMWQWMPAVVLIVVTTICIYGIGNAVRRAVNPRQRRQ